MRLHPLLTLSFVVVVSAITYLLLSDAGAGGDEVVERRLPRVERTSTGDATLELAGAEPSAGLRVASTVADIETEADEDRHPWASMLSGVTGRVVEEDGTPVVGLRVELLEGDLGVLFEADFTVMGRQDLAVGESETDAEGRFFIEGAMFSGLHAFAIDSGGGRATLRALEHGLEPGELTDVGDIVLAECGTVTGTVLDEDGEPVAGARVRIAPVPELALQTGILDLREGCMVAGGEGDRTLGIQLPSFLMSNLARLPIPTTMTEADGTFRLEGVPLATVSGGVDKAGYVATIIPTFTLDTEEHSVGELDLEVGRTIVGRVVDTLGAPIAGAEVCAGALSPLFPGGILQPAGVTGADGTFSVPGISDLGQAAASARRDARESWVTAMGVGASPSVEVVLATAAPLTVRAVDEAGEPVVGARVRLSQEGEGTNEVPSALLAMFDIRSNQTKPLVDEREPGVYVVDALGLGQWIVRVESPRHAPAEASLEQRAEGSEVEIVCRAARRLDVLVVDAATGEPVDRAFVRVAGPSDRLLGGYASAFTNPEGRASLAPLPRPGDTSLHEGLGAFELEPFLTAEHPEYGGEASLLPKQGDAVTLELTPACALTGTVTWAGVTPPEPYMVSLARTGAGDGRDRRDPTLMLSMMMSTPRSTLTGLDGSFRFPGLAAGTYEVLVFRRFLDSDPFDLLLGKQRPELVLSQSVDVVAGSANHVDVVLEPDGEPPRVRFTGRVTVEGDPVVGATVTVSGKGESHEVATDAYGVFDTEPVAVGARYRIRIEGEAADPLGVVERRKLLDTARRPEADGENRVDVRIEYGRIVVEVIDAATGVGVEGAIVTASGAQAAGSAQTAAGGLATLHLDSRAPGRRRISVRHPDYRSDSERSRIDPVDPAPHVRFELTRSVPCAGQAILPPGMQAGGRVGMNLRRVDGGRGTWHQFDDEELTFRIGGLLPGTYRAWAWSGRRRTQSLTFDLGATGDENLVLQFEALD